MIESSAMKKYKNHKGKERICIVWFSVIIVLMIGVLSVMFVLEQRQGTFPSQGGSDHFEYEGKSYILKKNTESLLVLGLDKFESGTVNSSYNNDQQADFLLLIVIDNDERSVSALQINRDTMTEMSVLGLNGNRIATVTRQIALSHTYGDGREVSCHNVAEAVSGLLMDVRIDRCLSMKMDAVAIFNDLVGGVEVTLTEDFSDVDGSMAEGETVVLTGEQALLYVRSRYGLENSSHIARMERQRQYLESLYGSALRKLKTDGSFVADASLAMADFVISDCSASYLQSLAEKCAEYEFEGICTLDGASVKGDEFMEFYPYEDSLRRTVLELFYKCED